MSYIRALSNPDSLYAWHDVDGDVKLCSPHVCSSRVPYGKPGMLSIPHAIFVKVCWKWKADNDVDVDVKHKGFLVNEGLMEGEGRLGVKLEWKGEYIILWPVTWESVVNDVTSERRMVTPKRRKRKR